VKKSLTAGIARGRHFFDSSAFELHRKWKKNSKKKPTWHTKWAF